jgi:tol-pal system protein YbgF
MSTLKLTFAGALRSALLVLALGQSFAHASLFDDDEARRAILDLRQKVDAISAKQTAETQRVADAATEEQAQLRRSLFDLQSQIDALKQDLATLRGQNETLTQQVVSLQRTQKDMAQGVEKRLSEFEPSDVSLDGKTFKAEPAETKDYEAALSQFRQGNFPATNKLFVAFVGRYPYSGYGPAALFWLGNSQYATRDYVAAIANFKAMIKADPQSARAPEAALSIANCQTDMKDLKAAKKTLQDLVAAFPNSEAAATAKDRLAKLK